MVLLPHHIESYPDRHGLPSVAVTFDLTPVQVDASLHALRAVREARFAAAQISTDDALALREFTMLVDVLADLCGRGGVARIQASVARLGVLRDGLAHFVSGELLEREGDSIARPVVFDVLDAVHDIHARAVVAALDTALTTER